jgi:hypothetical protein
LKFPQLPLFLVQTCSLSVFLVLEWELSPFLRLFSQPPRSFLIHSQTHWLHLPSIYLKLAYVPHRVAIFP